jgi:hypothetical protein
MTDQTNGASSEKGKTWTSSQQVIAFILVGAFVLVIFGWMFAPPRSLDQSALTVINILIGALVASMTTIVAFYFGSSEGSKAKDDAQNRTIERLTPLIGTGGGNAAAVVAAAKEAAPAAAKEAAPPAADIAAPPAAEAAVERAIEEHKL